MNIKTEMKIYRLLGVEQFRKLVFMLEKFLHRKDHGKNINYHIAGVTEAAAKKFVKYLFYNGSIHTRNILYIAIYAVLRIVLGKHFSVFDLVIGLLGVKDVYCIMLQRYNFLQIQEFQTRMAAIRSKKIKKKSASMQERFNSTYDQTYREQDLKKLKEMQYNLSHNIPIIMDEEMAQMLKRLSVVTE